MDLEKGNPVSPTTYKVLLKSNRRGAAERMVGWLRISWFDKSFWQDSAQNVNLKIAEMERDWQKGNQVDEGLLDSKRNDKFHKEDK